MAPACCNLPFDNAPMLSEADVRQCQMLFISGPLHGYKWCYKWSRVCGWFLLAWPQPGWAKLLYKAGFLSALGPGVGKQKSQGTTRSISACLCLTAGCQSVPETAVSELASGRMWQVGPLNLPGRGGAIQTSGKMVGVLLGPEPHIWVYPGLFLWTLQGGAPSGHVGMACRTQSLGLPKTRRCVYQVSHDGKVPVQFPWKCRESCNPKPVSDTFWACLCCCLHSRS